MPVGIEAMNFYAGSAAIDVRTIFEARDLDISRINNLMMEIKSVGLPCEDVITNGVNAAKPIIDSLSEDEKNRIELVITGSESGIDFGKSASTYIHDYLGLSNKCRLFEIKQACYGGTAALQMAAYFVSSPVNKGAKALVISSDIARAAARKTYAEPTQAIGASALLISENPKIMELDFGANGYCGFEVMDTCRPQPNIEAGDSDLSLLSYLDCLKNSFQNYCEKVKDVDLKTTFDYLAFHTPFAGMVRGAHRKLMSDVCRASRSEIEADFQRRVQPSLSYCVKVGNVYSATLYLALCGIIDHEKLDTPKRVGMFAYGSGCSSEFFSGVITSNSQKLLGKMKIGEMLSKRYKLNMEEYDNICDQNMEWIFGIKDKEVDFSKFSEIYTSFFEGRKLLALKRITGFHREYVWS